MPVKKTKINNKKNTDEGAPASSDAKKSVHGGKKKRVTHKKSTSSKNSKKKLGSRERSEIKKVASAIPSLIIEHMNFDEATLPEPRRFDSAEMYKYTEDQTKKKMIAWIGVGIIMLIISAMWLLNIRTNFYDVKRTQSLEGELFGDAKENLGDLMSGFTSTKDENKNETVPTTIDPNIEATLKQNLSAILAEIASSTTSTPRGASTTTVSSTASTTSTEAETATSTVRPAL